MRVLYVTSEVFPLVKTGGLGDVSAALPAALADIGVDVRLLLPGYPAILDGLQDARTAAALDSMPGAGDGRLIQGHLPDGSPALVIDAPQLFARPGNPYVEENGRDWWDNHRRFAALGWVAAQLAAWEVVAGWRPDVIHAHDWQAGLAPAYLALRPGPRPATIMTIHNIAYQGLFSPDVLEELRLPPESFRMHGLEYYGKVGFLKAGLFYADKLTTVSPSYAEEIRATDQGCGLEGLLAARAGDLVGIVNGVDYRIWDPAADPHLAAPYDVERLDAKAANKRALQAECGFDPDPAAPLFAVVSRLSPQKGLDLVLEAVPHLVRQGARLMVLGSGDRPLEDGFRRAAAEYPGAVAVRIGYDEALSHRIQGGADLIMVPSRSEPCGLTQLYGLRYGTLPLVRATGGLKDTVRDVCDQSLADGTATGFVFGPDTAEALTAAIDRAIDFHRQTARWRRVQATAMTRDFSWDRSARHYADLYRTVRPH